MSWTVYRVLDDEGTCIYAGVTTDIKKRWTAHRSKLEGAAKIVELGTYSDEWDALMVEDIVIDAERPRLNIRGNPGHGQEPETDRQKVARLTDTLVTSSLDHRRFLQHALKPPTTSDLLRKLADVLEREATAHVTAGEAAA